MQLRRSPLPPQPGAAAGDAEARVSGRRGAVGLCAALDGAHRCALMGGLLALRTESLPSLSIVPLFSASLRGVVR
jgi:hypothetical protein